MALLSPGEWTGTGLILGLNPSPGRLMTCCQAETTASQSCTVDKHVRRRYSWGTISIAVYYGISYDTCLSGTWSLRLI